MSFIQLASSKLPTKYGDFNLIAYESNFNNFPHIVLQSQIPVKESIVPIRIHSECMTGDVFNSLKCDCGDQLDFAMEYISIHGGIIIYLRQEGRGIGMVNKIKAYELQDKGLNTIEANHALGFETDLRDFSIAIEILKDLKIVDISLLTNNPEKMEVFENSGIKLHSRIPIVMQSNKNNESYLNTKKDQLGHFLK
jgi:GTP cyclohydrolase II